jgi:hypothetical protein
MTHEPSSGRIDSYISEDARVILEDRFWLAVEETSTLEAVSGDGSLMSESGLHPALYADHGIVHARDVAIGVIELAGTANGLLLPERPADRREFVAGLAVLHTYIHDIGMHDVTPEGRRLHAVRAAQIPFSGEMDDVLVRLWESGGPVVTRISSVSAAEPFSVSDDVVLRELISLSVGHSKSTVPAALYTDFAGFRRVLQEAVLTDQHLYSDPARDAYAWLDSPQPAHRALADDALDAVRLVRAADALRQRGTTLRTAAGYEIFIDADTGQAVFSLRTVTGEQLFLLRLDSPLSAGEANIRKAEVTPSGDLRVSFHRGRFSSAGAAAAACDATARVVADIGADVLGAFDVRRPSSDLPAPLRAPGSMRVELERPADEPTFAEAVAAAVTRLDPLLAARVFVVADLENAAPVERARYLEGIPISADSDETREILSALGAHGMRVEGIDRRKAFEDVRRVSVGEGEMLMEAGSHASFVYIAIGCSLRIEQRGGYGDIKLSPWIPVGTTGVVRRAERSSNVVATEPGEVLIIPGELFAREWFQPYERGELADAIDEIAD